MDASTSETSSYLWAPLQKTQQMAFFYFLLLCSLTTNGSLCLKYILCWILTIAASLNLHSLQLIVVPYTPIRFFFSWWRGFLLVSLLLPSISSSYLVFTYAFHLALFLFLITIDFFLFLKLPSYRPLQPQNFYLFIFILALLSTPYLNISCPPSLPPFLRWTAWAYRAAVSSVPWRCWGGRVPWSDWGCWGRLSVWVTSCPRFLPCSPSDTPTASARAIPTEWASTRFKRQVLHQIRE